MREKNRRKKETKERERGERNIERKRDMREKED